MQQAALDKSSPLARIAAIDVDGTLYSERAAQLAFLRLLRSSGLLGWADLARLAAIFLAHRCALLDPAQARRRGMAVLDGLPAFEAELLADQLVAALLPRVAREAREEIAELQRRGCRVLLVSAGLSMVVGRLAAALDADGYLATELAVVAGRCRAAFVGPVVEGPHKWSALRSYADRRFGAGGWQLAYAYGNSTNDLPLLAQAERAVAVNAQRKLTHAALRRGWRRVSWQ